MTSRAMVARRVLVRRFDVSVNRGSGDGITSRVAFGMAMVAMTIAAAFTVFELALRTADQVFVDQAALTPPEQADVTFGTHRLSFPGVWLTSPAALDDEMATAVTLQVSYGKLLALLGASSALDTADGTNPYQIVIRLQMPPPGMADVDLLNEVYVPKSQSLSRDGPADLSARRFLAGSGYDNEVLYLGREQDAVFIARCVEDGTDVIRRPCLRTLAISPDLEAVAQFAPALLADWRKLDSLIDAFIRSITVR